MRKFTIFFISFLCSMFIYGEEINPNANLEIAMNYYFNELIPKYYQGQEDFSKEMNICHSLGFGMQGNGFSVFDDKEDIVFNFYYQINMERQDCTCSLITEHTVDGVVYEYWNIKLYDIGVPYNYSYFYLTKADTKQDKREILLISRKYQDRYESVSGTILDLSYRDLRSLYISRPEEKIESFKGTKYEGKIVKWRGKEPYLRNMNLIEKIYYNHLEKSDK